MEQEHLFISDAHIGAFDPETEQQLESDLLDLITYATERKAQIYILGDFFDYWMEFPGSNFVPKIGSKLLDAFESYNSTVTPVLYITGNHDNWTINHFNSRGFDVESNFRIIEVFKKKIFLMHGDGLLSSDNKLKRPLLHRILRNRLFLKLYRGILPKPLAIRFMQIFSNSSKMNERRDPNPLNQNAAEILNRRLADVVLTGHDHIPRLETFNSGLYINLGTFFNHRTLVRGIDGVLSLVQWNAQQQTFNEYLDIT